jgi:AcrR family transcriptional regulator
MAPRPDDRRVKRTRRRLVDALVALVVEKGFESVTVQDILERADVGRSTFYAHYRDKHDLLIESFKGVGAFLAHEQQAVKAVAGHALGFSLAMFEHAAEQRKLIRAMVGKQSGAIIQKQLHGMIADMMRKELEAHVAAGAEPAIPLEITVEFAASAYIALLNWWFEQKLPYTPAEMDEIYRALVSPGLEAALAPRPAGNKSRG